MFTRKKLLELIIPLIIEQFFIMAVGFIDSIMVASCGESAISGISVVNTINNMVNCLLAALATGGAVVAAQFIGKKDQNSVSVTANQLFWLTLLFSGLLAAASFFLNQPILTTLYRNLEADVMENARIYFLFSAISYPFYGIYNSGAALFRAVGNSKISMKISFWANVANVIGNAIFIYGLRLGVTGAALSTFLSRILSAVLIMFILHKNEEIHFTYRPMFHSAVIKKILYIGIPSSFENGIPQIGRMFLAALTASFGTIAITADSVTCNIGNFQLIPSEAIGIAMTTVIGQLAGAEDREGMRKYAWKLVRLSHLSLLCIGILLFLLEKPLFLMYHLSDDTIALVKLLLNYNIVCLILMQPLSYAIPAALRAANDVHYTMVVSIATMWICRIGFAYFLGKYIGLGIFGVWVAMTIEWCVRALFFVPRFTYLTSS
ncbi:MAG: MATE family efflux transporter [Clostridium sp.]|nr:MATE family efflux transporter [Clostridium sp.]